MKRLYKRLTAGLVNEKKSKQYLSKLHDSHWQVLTLEILTKSTLSSTFWSELTNIKVTRFCVDIK